MSDAPLIDVNRNLEDAKVRAFELGVSKLIDPFMTLSFMSLPVIPKLRLTTRGCSTLRVRAMCKKLTDE